MNYRHGFHAGSFTDVCKHLVLLTLIDYLTKKDAPFLYLETHAGRGYYGLTSEMAQKTKEYQGGIELIVQQDTMPAAVSRYVACVRQINQDLSGFSALPLAYYPGSPLFAREMIRHQDEMILSELHREEYQVLKEYFHRDPRVHIHLQDGYQGLKAFLPPRARRGLVLIDPPYEEANELNRIVEQLSIALKKFQTGIYAVWYPIKDMDSINRWYKKLKTLIQQPMLVAELTIYPNSIATRLNGCGMLIVNPPWQVDQAIADYYPWLWQTLSPDQQGGYLIHAL